MIFNFTKYSPKRILSSLVGDDKRNHSRDVGVLGLASPQSVAEILKLVRFFVMYHMTTPASVLDVMESMAVPNTTQLDIPYIKQTYTDDYVDANPGYAMRNMAEDSLFVFSRKLTENEAYLAAALSGMTLGLRTFSRDKLNIVTLYVNADSPSNFKDRFIGSDAANGYYRRVDGMLPKEFYQLL